MENDRNKFKSEFKQRIYAWVLRLIRFINKLPKSTTHEVIGKQLLRSGTSILANHVEAGSASSKKDFANFFNYSLKSANESEIWLTLLGDLSVGNNDELNWLLRELKEISNIIARSIITIRKK